MESVVRSQNGRPEERQARDQTVQWREGVLGDDGRRAGAAGREGDGLAERQSGQADRGHGGDTVFRRGVSLHRDHGVLLAERNGAVGKSLGGAPGGAGAAMPRPARGGAPVSRNNVQDLSAGSRRSWSSRS